MDNSYTLTGIDNKGAATTAATRRKEMYQYQYDDLYDSHYDEVAEVHYVDRAIESLIEELYSSKTLNRQAIADALNNISFEITPTEGFVLAKHITLEYVDNAALALDAWLDALDPITGELNYMRLSNPSCGQCKKELAKFENIFDAFNTLVFQLTTLTPFDDSKVAGALVFLAKRYEVKYEDAKLYQPNVKRI